jgi:hypothetical protein
MQRSTDPRDNRQPFWRRGAQTRRHIYFYPSDDRAGIALMLLIATLGLLAMGIGLRHVFTSLEVLRADVILVVVGVLAASLGLYQANRLRNRG